VNVDGKRLSGGVENEKAEHLILSCHRSEAEYKRQFGESVNTTNVFGDYASLLKFLVSSEHLPHKGTA